MGHQLFELRRGLDRRGKHQLASWMSRQCQKRILNKSRLWCLAHSSYRSDWQLANRYNLREHRSLDAPLQREQIHVHERLLESQRILQE